MNLVTSVNRDLMIESGDLPDSNVIRAVERIYRLETLLSSFEMTSKKIMIRAKSMKMSERVEKA